MHGVAIGNLSLALEKCFVCSIANRSQNLPYHVYDINNDEHAYVNSIRDLGVTIYSHLKFDQNPIVHKAMSIKLLIHGIHHYWLKAYCTYVRPMLEYCSPVWSPHSICLINIIKKVQQFFTKQIAV